jgi:hypothetical protein
VNVLLQVERILIAKKILRIDQHRFTKVAPLSSRRLVLELFVMHQSGTKVVPGWRQIGLFSAKLYKERQTPQHLIFCAEF